MIKKITTGATVHDEKEIRAVLEVLNTSTQMGECTSIFEQEVSKLFNKKYGIGVIRLISSTFGSYCFG